MMRSGITDSRSQFHRGFTLVELMIVVVILSILVGIGYPSYQNSIIKSKRSLARAALSDFVSRQESFYLDRKQYAQTPQALGYPNNTIIIGSDGQIKNTGTVTSDTVYALNLGSSTALDAVDPNLPATGPRGYTIRATPQNSQANDTDCGQLAMTNNGKKVASGTNNSNCW